MNRHADAISRYTMAANIAIQRPPWEANQHLREELSTVICNRSAAHFESGDFISAIADADTVIRLRRNWSKGHFRKAKALLALDRWQDAKESVRLGLQFEPDNKVCLRWMIVRTRHAHTKFSAIDRIPLRDRESGGTCQRGRFLQDYYFGCRREGGRAQRLVNLFVKFIPPPPHLYFMALLMRLLRTAHIYHSLINTTCCQSSASDPACSS
jgi:tetratricopeptide (TPR) repeat protein